MQVGDEDTLTSQEQFCGRVTIRLPKQKIDRYLEFKELVTKQLHSDVCYVIGELIESFTVAIKQTKEPPVTMIFPKQNIQINMGCTFHYNVKKAKRLPTHQKLIQTEKNYLLPQLIDLWHELTPQAKHFWKTQLQQAGITPPPSDKSHTLLHRLKKKIRKLFFIFHRK